MKSLLSVALKGDLLVSLPSVFLTRLILSSVHCALGCLLHWRLRTLSKRELIGKFVHFSCLISVSWKVVKDGPPNKWIYR